MTDSRSAHPADVWGRGKHDEFVLVCEWKSRTDDSWLIYAEPVLHGKKWRKRWNSGRSLCRPLTCCVWLTQGLDRAESVYLNSWELLITLHRPVSVSLNKTSMCLSNKKRKSSRANDATSLQLLEWGDHLSHVFSHFWRVATFIRHLAADIRVEN